MTTPRHPTNDWNWSDNAEEEFAEWFHELFNFSFRSEWFYTDCETKDEKTLKEAMYKWVHAAYVAGYESGSHITNRLQDAP
jgi:hypothetical protein